MPSCKTVSEHFVCTPDEVWAVLVDISRYRRWFGWPEPLDLIEADPAFALGGKLTFRNSASTLVVSAFQPAKKLVLTGGFRTDEFLIRPAENGCRVSLVTSLNGIGFQNTEAAQETCNRNILKNLRKLCYAQENDQQTPELRAQRFSSDMQDAQRRSNRFFRIARGYRPARTSELPADAGADTEQELSIPGRSAFLGAILSLLLVVVLSISLTFARSDIVPSSGLSVAESELVSFESAQNIYIGQKKAQLELMLSCTGQKLSAEQYTYSSIEKRSDGSAVFTIYVTYDAYGAVRRFGAIDTVLAECCGVPVCSVGSILSPSMTVTEASDAVGMRPSAFWVDKSGTSYLYFGRYLLGETLFDTARTAELVVSLDATNIRARWGYYLAESADNPLHIDQLESAAKRQYSSLALYRSDLAFYERCFLLPGLDRAGVDAVLGMADSVEEESLYGGFVRVNYLCAPTDDGHRYRFTVTFSAEGLAQGVIFENAHLAQKTDVLARVAGYELSDGISLYDAYAALRILPSYAQIDSDGSVTLAYGSRLRQSGSVRSSFELILWFGPDGLLTRAAHNQTD